jgi:hypothetical protein
MARGATRSGNTSLRYTVIAISKTEDPREGFHEYMFAEGGDFVRPVVDEEVLALTGDRTGGGSAVFLLSTDDLAKGAKDPRAQRYEQATFGTNMVPVVSHGPMTHMLVSEWPGSETEAVKLYAFSHALDGKPPITGTIPVKSARQLMLPNPNGVPTPVFRDGHLYFATVDAWDGKTATFCLRDEAQWVRTLIPTAGIKSKNQAQLDALKALGPCRIRLVGLDVTIGTKDITGKKIVDFSFGGRDKGDPADTVISYSMPSIEITKAGDVVVVFERTQYNTLDLSKEIYPEARYRVLYHQDNGKIRGSAVLSKGTCCDPHPSPNVKFGDTVTLPKQDSIWTRDITAAVLDPDDEQTVWMAGAFGIDPSTNPSDYGKPTAYQLVIGAVHP